MVGGQVHFKHAADFDWLSCVCVYVIHYYFVTCDRRKNSVGRLEDTLESEHKEYMDIRRQAEEIENQVRRRVALQT